MSDDPKPTGNEDFDLLIKCMGMTTSDNDNVKLVSINKANAILEKKGFTWDALLRGRVKVIADPYTQVNGQAAAPVAPTTTTRTAMRSGSPMPPPQPQPQHIASSSSSSSGLRYSRFAASCHLCAAKLAAGNGMLSGAKNLKGNYLVECLPGRGCKAPGYVAPKRKPKMGSGGLADLL